MKKQLPNLITALNLLCGSLAILFVVTGDLVVSSFLHENRIETAIKKIKIELFFILNCLCEFTLEN